MTAAAHPLGEYSTATISDALDRLGVPGALLGIAPLFDGARLCGRAFTVRYVPASSPPGTVGDYLDDVSPGEVVVLDNAGRLDCTVWGDILTAMADDRGVAGTVIGGVCRDVARAIGDGYPIFSAGRFMRTGKDRVEVAEVGGAVAVGGARIEPGDLLVGDADGVVAVPWGLVDEVLPVCERIVQRESGILRGVLAGMGIAEARERYGYHLLQRQGGDEA
ncbi:RraA family protein [Leucobacter sp. wl10]|uniref:RraA family protein n=1 Tax=Leucobacter sp. wl10 TaxID=2304677 RepID=UPI000E5B1147|nr:RraA family protein [Leucobacter sp. wl10]RGE18961.1 RraA family protein [Leucobacter sp. wl10]